MSDNPADVAKNSYYQLGSGRFWRVEIRRKVSAGQRSACVYTTVIGGYEPLNEQPVAASSRLPFVCLTDDPNLASDSWQIRHVTPLFGMDPVRSQRALKLHPHDYLQDFDCSLYIDNSVLLKIEPESVIEQHLDASGFCLPPHSFRETVLDEFMEVDALGLDEPARCFEQLHHYTIEFPEVLQERPFWAGILLRDHRNAKVRAMLELWWAHVQRYSRRDQLSINVAFVRAGFQPDLLGIDNFELVAAHLAAQCSAESAGTGNLAEHAQSSDLSRATV